MVEILIHILITSVLLLLIAKIVSGIEIDDWGAAIFAAIVLGVINAIIKPLLIILTIPITVLTLGLFLLVINALMLWMVGGLVRGVKIAGFWYALLGSIVLSILNLIVGIFL
jgi:putative membrane protein